MLIHFDHCGCAMPQADWPVVTPSMSATVLGSHEGVRLSKPVLVTSRLCERDSRQLRVDGIVRQGHALILDADASNVAVLLQLGVVDKLAVLEWREEVVVEVAARLDSDNEALLERHAEAEVLEERLGRLALRKAADVVDVDTEEVADAVRVEGGGEAFRDELGDDLVLGRVAERAGLEDADAKQATGEDVVPV